MAMNGHFREDLYYRLNGFSIKLPPLRERGDDVQLLISRFVQRFGKEVGKEVRGLSPDSLELLTRYPWPGNVRELQAVLRQALLQTTGPLILPEFLPDDVRHYHDRAPRVPHAASGMPASDLQAFVDHELQKRSHDLYAETIAMVDRYVLRACSSIRAAINRKRPSCSALPGGACVTSCVPCTSQSTRS